MTHHPAIIGYYTTRFGELWDKSLFQLVREAVDGVMASCRTETESMDAIFFSNMMGGILENNLHAGAKLAEVLGVNLPIFRTEAACASGGMAVHLATQYVTARPGTTVLVVGAEKMTDYAPEETASALMSAASGEEQSAGLTFPGLYAMLANVYLETYGYARDCLAPVPHKNHFHGSLNEQAHFRKQISIREILASPPVASPLTLLDCSPISDGASAIIVSSNKSFIKKSAHAISILATEVATDTISLKGRGRLDELAATRIASEKAFGASGIKPRDINVAELHDCFSIAELLAMEDIGFWKKGTAGQRAKELSTMLGSGGTLTVNTSGGLKAAGHPVGATGIKQIGELFLQLTGQAGKRQVKKAAYGLAHNVGGSGGTAVVTILGQR